MTCHSYMFCLSETFSLLSLVTKCQNKTSHSFFGPATSPQKIKLETTSQLLNAPFYRKTTPPHKCCTGIWCPNNIHMTIECLTYKGIFFHIPTTIELVNQYPYAAFFPSISNSYSSIAPDNKSLSDVAK